MIYNHKLKGNLR